MKLNSQALPSFEGFKANVEAHEETLRGMVGRRAARNIGRRSILGGHFLSSKDHCTPTRAPLGEIINRLQCALPWGGSGAARLCRAIGVVLTGGILSAGITISPAEAFENKMVNEDARACLANLAGNGKTLEDCFHQVHENCVERHMDRDTSPHLEKAQFVCLLEEDFAWTRQKMDWTGQYLGFRETDATFDARTYISHQIELENQAFERCKSKAEGPFGGFADCLLSNTKSELRGLWGLIEEWRPQ